MQPPSTAWQWTDTPRQSNLHNLVHSAQAQTSMPPPLSPADRPTPAQVDAMTAAEHQQHLSDVAGVLRRNQACLNCRRRKLKCDAMRPHCSTCQKSFKHVRRANPDADISHICQYDDGTGTVHVHQGPSTGNDAEERLPSGQATPEDEEPVQRKKRKPANPAARKKRKESDDTDQTDRLMKKIEDLEAQLLLKSQEASPQTSNQQQQQQQYQPPQDQTWLNKGQGVTAESPTAFLEMLSTAASAQAGSSANGLSNSNAGSNNNAGMKEGVAEDIMMSTAYVATPNQSTGLTPFLSFAENEAYAPPQPERQSTQSSFSSESNQPTAQASADSVTSAWASGSCLSINSMRLGPAKASNEMSIGPGGLEPSTRTTGPWRGVETIESTLVNLQASMQQVDAGVNINGEMLTADEDVQNQIFMDIFWPGWHQHLPEPHIVNELVEEFFETVPMLPRLLNKGRFMARLALPPTNANFPHPALLFAICALASSWCDPSVYMKGQRHRMGFAVPGVSDPSFAGRMAALGKEEVQMGLNTGNRLFDVVRAMIIFTRFFVDQSRMLETWAYVGLVTRMITPLGLTVRSAEFSLKSVMLPPPVDALEREERNITVWIAVFHETISSAASSWGGTMALDEVSICLPVAAKDFHEGKYNMPPNPQDIESSDFWTRHPVVDPFVMNTKGSVLMHRVCKFIRKWKNRHLKDNDDLEGMEKADFKELAHAASCLQMSFPASLRNPAKLSPNKKLDAELISAHMLPQTSIILLWEPFADIEDPDDGPTRHILTAAQMIIRTTQHVTGIAEAAGIDIASIMHSAVSISMITAARTLLLFYRAALNRKDLDLAEVHRADIESVRNVLRNLSPKFKLGQHHAQLLEYFLDRASYPTYEKLQAHWPEHPRQGGIHLMPGESDYGPHIMQALAVKRGFWKAPKAYTPQFGISPIGSTPDSANNASSIAGISSGGRPGSSFSESTGASRIIGVAAGGSPMDPPGYPVMSGYQTDVDMGQKFTPATTFAEATLPNVDAQEASPAGGLRKEFEQWFDSKLHNKIQTGVPSLGHWVDPMQNPMKTREN